jgi:hypothetical protein
VIARRDAIPYACLLVLAAVVYRPWTAETLPLTDFGTFMPLLDPSASIFTQLLDVVRHYAAEGRLALFPSVIFVTGAKAFGVWAPGWYWTYFALNAVVLALAWGVFRKCGATRGATFCALALWSVMSSAPEVWVRPTGEPVALIFFLVAFRLCINFADAQDWKWRAVWIACCAAAIIFCKELLVCLLPACWLVSRLRFDGEAWSMAAWGQRDTRLLAYTAAAVSGALAIVAFVALTAPAGNYASQFGSVADARSLTLHRLEMVWIPTRPSLEKLTRIQNDPGWFFVLVLPALVWLRLIGGGAWQSRRNGGLWPFAIAGVWTLVGLLAYLPWPIGDDFYMAPFALGAMFAASQALSRLSHSGVSTRRASFAVAGFLIAICSVEARNVVNWHAFRAKLYAGVVDQIRGGSELELLAAVPRPPLEARWGLSKSLEGFSGAVYGTRFTNAADVTCDEAKRALASGRRILIVSKEGGCGSLAENSRRIDAEAAMSQWPYLWKQVRLQGRMYVAATEAAATRN